MSGHGHTGTKHIKKLDPQMSIREALMLGAAPSDNCHIVIRNGVPYKVCYLVPVDTLKEIDTLIASSAA